MMQLWELKFMGHRRLSGKHTRRLGDNEIMITIKGDEVKAWVWNSGLAGTLSMTMLSW